MYVCIYVCLYVLMYVYMYVCMYVCMYVLMYVYMYVYMYVCMHVCMYVYICMYVCMCVPDAERLCVIIKQVFQSETQQSAHWVFGGKTSEGEAGRGHKKGCIGYKPFCHRSSTRSLSTAARDTK